MNKEMINQLSFKIVELWFSNKVHKPDKMIVYNSVRYYCEQMCDGLNISKSWLTAKITNETIRTNVGKISVDMAMWHISRIPTHNVMPSDVLPIAICMNYILKTLGRGLNIN